VQTTAPRAKAAAHRTAVAERRKAPPTEHREWSPPKDAQGAPIDLGEQSHLAFAHPPRVAIWIDGYGRRRLHIVIDLREEKLNRDGPGADETARLDPWHGYNPHRPENGY
jgi:hypothetical protein